VGLVIGQDVVEDVLGAALAGGADFAEVFGEDVRRGSVSLDDGRIESLASGARGQGLSRGRLLGDPVRRSDVARAVGRIRRVTPKR
jgi:hypothetical protein